MKIGHYRIHRPVVETRRRKTRRGETWSGNGEAKAGYGRQERHTLARATPTNNKAGKLKRVRGVAGWVLVVCVVGCSVF